MNATETVATEPKPTGKPKGVRMERFNIVLPVDHSEWIDRFAWEIRERNGRKVSRSEVIRAAIAGLRELHLEASAVPSKFVLLTRASSGSDLKLIAIIAARLATTEYRKYTTADVCKSADKQKCRKE